jgi:hypothetical protein
VGEGDLRILRLHFPSAEPSPKRGKVEWPRPPMCFRCGPHLTEPNCQSACWVRICHFLTFKNAKALKPLLRLSWHVWMHPTSWTITSCRSSGHDLLFLWPCSAATSKCLLHIKFPRRLEKYIRQDIREVIFIEWCHPNRFNRISPD